MGLQAGININLIYLSNKDALYKKSLKLID